MAEESVGDAGANHLGYYTGGWGPGGAAIAAHGFTGALHIWRRQPDGDGWLPHHALGGHFAQGGCLVMDSAVAACLLTLLLCCCCCRCAAVALAAAIGV